MKAVEISEIKKVTLIDKPEPQITETDDVIVKIKSIGICGTDVHTYMGEHPFVKPPVVVGHECGGEVVECGPDVKNVSVRIEKLNKAGLIVIEKSISGNKKYIRTKSGDKTKNYFVELLKEIKKRKEGISEKELMSLLPVSFDDIRDQDKFSAPIRLLYTEPKLVEKVIKISSEGERFLKENSKK